MDSYHYRRQAGLATELLSTVSCDDKIGVLGSAATQVSDEQLEVSFAPRRYKRVMLKFPNGLVASSDRRIRRELAQILQQCGLAPVVASTVAETGVAIVRHEVSIVLCNDCLGDGNYEDILRLLASSDTKAPLIVVSRTGDWAEYLAAIREGVFDYLAFPPIPGDLQRVIRNALRQEQHLDAA
jgi:ActR/RegA family two-component response regulator